MLEQHPGRRGKAAAKLTPRSPSGTSARHRYRAAVKTRKTKEVAEEGRREREERVESAAACSAGGEQEERRSVCQG